MSCFGRVSSSWMKDVVTALSTDCHTTNTVSCCKTVGVKRTGNSNCVLSGWLSRSSIQNLVLNYLEVILKRHLLVGKLICWQDYSPSEFLCFVHTVIQMFHVIQILQNLMCCCIFLTLDFIQTSLFLWILFIYSLEKINLFK